MTWKHRGAALALGVALGCIPSILIRMVGPAPGKKLGEVVLEDGGSFRLWDGSKWVTGLSHVETDNVAYVYTGEMWVLHGHNHKDMIPHWDCQSCVKILEQIGRREAIVVLKEIAPVNTR